MRVNYFVTAIVLVFIVSGCSNETNVTHINTTLGEEIVALKKALDSGAIEQGQYDQLVEGLSLSRRAK